MPTTMTPAVSNNIATFKKYVDDPNNMYAVWRKSSVTVDLETPMGEFGDNAEFSYPVFPFEDGDIPDYSKANGYTTDTTTYERRSVIFTQDKGYSISIDYRDLKESHLTAVAIYNNKVRMRDVPSVDRYRLSKLVAGTGITGNARKEILSKVTGALTVANILTEIDAAKQAMFDAEVPTDSGLILYLKSANYTILKNSNKIERRVENGEGNINRDVEYLDNIKIRPIPSGRFPANTEFVLVQPACLICGIKLEITDFFERSERFSGCLVNKRIVHDLKIQEDRANGVYVAKTEAPQE